MLTTLMENENTSAANISTPFRDHVLSIKILFNIVQLFLDCYGNLF